VVATKSTNDKQTKKIKTHKWTDVKARMKPDVRARAEARVQATLARDAVHLAELRKVRHLTQEQLAETMGNSQSDISKIERSADMLISTMRRFAAAAGGRLRLIVEWEDGDQTEVSLTGMDTAS
jgi:DNA-binding XRE family transcriptional regulator